MNHSLLRAFLATGALATMFASSGFLGGCVADRPSRNGVFNENQYLRKEFLVRPATPGPDGKPQADNGWMLKATIVATSTPNPLGGLNLSVGSENEGAFVRFNITQDHLQLINLREINVPSVDQAAQGTRENEVVNAWPATSFDLKYRINLDGEKTNFYEENQELDWQVRQWVKINFAKNDLSDLAPFGRTAQMWLEKCTDLANSSSTLVPDSFKVDEPGGYLAWKVGLVLPLKFEDASCVQGYASTYNNAGALFQRLGRSSVDLTVAYSMVRAVAPEKITYQPLELGEKDPIRKKYGVIDNVYLSRDQNTGLIGARAYALRYDPTKPIVWYFAAGYPEAYRSWFTAPNGIVDQTNKILADSGAAARLTMLNYNDDKTLGDGKGPAREYGDIRYNFIRWETDYDTGAGYLAVTDFVPDPRTGELISASINVANYNIEDAILKHLDFYLDSIGSLQPLNANGEWPDGPANCKDGDTIPIGFTDPMAVQKNHNGHSSIYAKMQDYLQKPIAKFGNLGVRDFVPQQDQDFFNAYYAILPYQLYADPDKNQYTTPEGGTSVFGPQAQYEAMAKEAEFQKLAGSLDKGYVPFDVNDSTTGLQQAQQFLHQFKQATSNHLKTDYIVKNGRGLAKYDDAGIIQFQDAFTKNARHCVNGKWESRAEYVKAVTDSYHALTVWHEFGHVMGLQHNFMASVDRPNFPHYKDATGRDHIGMYQSSVMEYNNDVDRVFWKASGGGPGWGPYDRAAIAFIYGNSGSTDQKPPRGLSLSGQTSPTAPWNDPYGFAKDGKTETQYLRCDENHSKYSPWCRPFDFGTTPSEIIAAEIETYEWQYKWRNFRLYRKFIDFSPYANGPTGLISELRRFMSAWEYDWTSSEITDTLRRIGVASPPGVPAQTYYGALTDKFQKEMSAANQMVAAFHKAVIQQSSGERPFKTIYDNFYGDVTQQGIFLDKLIALQSWTALWQVENFDPNQAQGAYLTSFGGSFGDQSYNAIAQDVVDSMVGGQYDIFPFSKPLAVSSFAQATHDINFAGRIDIRDWVGGHVFTRERDFLDYFRGLAAKYNTYGCTSFDTCTYDPRPAKFDANDIGHSDDFNEFTGPDSRRWIWVFVQDRNTWVAVDRDRNTTSYVIMRNYTNDVIHGEDEGFGGAYSSLIQVKYFLDSFNQFN